METIAEAELGEEAIPQDKLMELLEPNNPDDDVYVTYEFDDKKPAVKSEPLDSEGGQSGLAEVSGGNSPVAAMLEDDDDDLEGHTMRFVIGREAHDFKPSSSPSAGGHCRHSCLAGSGASLWSERKLQFLGSDRDPGPSDGALPSLLWSES